MTRLGSAADGPRRWHLTVGRVAARVRAVTSGAAVVRAIAAGELRLLGERRPVNDRLAERLRSLLHGLDPVSESPAARARASTPSDVQPAPRSAHPAALVGRRATRAPLPAASAATSRPAPDRGSFAPDAPHPFDRDAAPVPGTSAPGATDDVDGMPWRSSASSAADAWLGKARAPRDPTQAEASDWPRRAGLQAAALLRRLEHADVAPASPLAVAREVASASTAPVEIHNVFHLGVPAPAESADDLADRVADLLADQARSYGIDVP